ncbi:hypothetical protein [Paraburkholderia sp. D1E]|uniref:hypothetical protein n=1 Tax=Paraburkholderia sp. D1E TaxID=3461398 RepID=UPI004045AFD7
MSDLEHFFGESIEPAPVEESEIRKTEKRSGPIERICIDRAALDDDHVDIPSFVNGFEFFCC